MSSPDGSVHLHGRRDGREKEEVASMRTFREIEIADQR
jgi:hypothetical protein